MSPVRDPGRLTAPAANATSAASATNATTATNTTNVTASTTPAPTPAATGATAAEEATTSVAVAGERTVARCSLPVSAEAVPRMRRFAREALTHWDLPESAGEATCLVVTELVTNVLLHSGSQEVSLLIALRGCALTVQVDDAGRWKRRDVPRRSSADVDARCGRGLRLVDAYAVSCEVCTGEHGTRVSAEIAVCA